MDFSTPVTLENTYVRLEPLDAAHAPGLERACVGLEHAWYTSTPTPETVADDFAARIRERDAGAMNPFVVRRLSTGEVVGETTFCNIDQANRHVEIGATWLSPTVHRSEVNTAAKLALLTHAFETCDAIAVEFMTHWHNLQSRAAIARLGAKQDGVRRSHRIGADGIIRDTVVFSIIRGEWPAVRRGLEERLARG